MAGYVGLWETLPVSTVGRQTMEFAYLARVDSSKRSSEKAENTWHLLIEVLQYFRGLTMCLSANILHPGGRWLQLGA